MTTFQTHFPSAFDSVAKARHAVGSFAQSCGFSSSEVSDIVLAVGEACSNAVEHGHTPAGRLLVRAAFQDGVLQIEITDEGRGVDEAVTRGDAVLDAVIGRGRGIVIMRALMDAVRHASGPSGTTVFLEKRLSARGAGEALDETLGVDSGGAGQPR